MSTTAEREYPRLRTLGGFTLYRTGRPVRAGEWRSRKARELLILLVARRHESIRRERVSELLWPGTDPASCRNRLSVALCTVRGMLDPRRQWAPDIFVTTYADAVRLTNLPVDAYEFLAGARRALRAHQAGAELAYCLLLAADAAYTGDFCTGDPCLEYAVPLREEVRATHVAVLRALASAAADIDDTERQHRCFLRLLEHDPFDEFAQVGLVRLLRAQRRLGEASRRYAHYARRMAELGCRPRPLAELA
ncbi:AfsR/SARP family transcriptional regulator [Amycolatopsis cihanbeyliensis]|uniref:DNA-binding SARP family transcriptional activator n=1 Tax=Amycolatopsis cihanbeyliensis TaxID=1128664 RepID=A0A542DCZ8_AMYCI|nr:BTAD domain-containing putative transcriptional regulator [Amycolatopsis cihanbeyliensis]TQJ00951.1 DNA-binding SARP family transcriptional activator [Amycolatopsis cihanbeyliensis]